MSMSPPTSPAFVSFSTKSLGKKPSKAEAGLPTSMPIPTIDPADDYDDRELKDIRRRRKQVIERYNSRLEYLKARLKSAELHEKLMRR